MRKEISLKTQEQEKRETNESFEGKRENKERMRIVEKREGERNTESLINHWQSEGI